MGTKMTTNLDRALRETGRRARGPALKRSAKKLPTLYSRVDCPGRPAVRNRYTGKPVFQRAGVLKRRKCGVTFLVVPFFFHRKLGYCSERCMVDTLGYDPREGQGHRQLGLF